MMKRLALWLFKEILWPVLQYLLIDVLTELARWLLAKFKEILRTWEQEETSRAATPEAAQEVKEKYERRRQDIERVSADAAREISRIVREAFLRVEAERDRLLEGPESTS